MHKRNIRRSIYAIAAASRGLTQARVKTRILIASLSPAIGVEDVAENPDLSPDLSEAMVKEGIARMDLRRALGLPTCEPDETERAF